MSASEANTPTLWKRRSLSCWLRVAALIFSSALAACTSSTPPRQYERPPSQITGKDHRDGTSEPNNTFWLRW
jgi:hypothetical protein